jgi:hypothetical protein
MQHIRGDRVDPAEEGFLVTILKTCDPTNDLDEDLLGQILGQLGIGNPNEEVSYHQLGIARIELTDRRYIVSLSASDELTEFICGEHNVRSRRTRPRVI